jgi:hypothetical protein
MNHFFVISSFLPFTIARFIHRNAEQEVLHGFRQSEWSALLMEDSSWNEIAIRGRRESLCGDLTQSRGEGFFV